MKLQLLIAIGHQDYMEHLSDVLTQRYYMDPQGSTTRAQLAVLLHRLSVFVENQTV